MTTNQVKTESAPKTPSIHCTLDTGNCTAWYWYNESTDARYRCKPTHGPINAGMMQHAYAKLCSIYATCEENVSSVHNIIPPSFSWSSRWTLPKDFATKLLRFLTLSSHPSVRFYISVSRQHQMSRINCASISLYDIGSWCFDSSFLVPLEYFPRRFDFIPCWAESCLSVEYTSLATVVRITQ
jgi:hypothetical protein